MNYKEDSKRLRMYTDNCVKCKCGHSQFMPVFLPHKICDWCGKMVFRNKQEEFKYKLKHEMKKKK